MVNAKMHPPAGFIRPGDFARRYGAPPNHIHAMAMRGDLEYIRVGRCVFIAEDQKIELNPDWKHVNGRTLGSRKWVASKL